MEKDFSWPADADLFQHDSIPESPRSSMWRSSYVGSDSDMPTIITKRMLKEHSAKVNAWLVVDGVTWDVAGFLDRHPGGLKPISKGLGKDASKLFNKVHPQIYPGDHIGVVFVGIYMPNNSSPVHLKKKMFSSWFPSPAQCLGVSNQKVASNFNISFCFYETEEFIVLEVTHNPPKYIKLRAWSWILTLHDKRTFAVTIHTLPGFCKRAEFNLKDRVGTEFLYLKFYDDYKRVTVLFKKFFPGKKWKSFGDPTCDTNGMIVSCKEVVDETRCHLFFRKKITPSTFVVGMKIRPSTYMKIPPGYWIKVSAEGCQELFYPVVYSLVGDGNPSCETSVSGEPIYLLIRMSQESLISQLLCSKRTDSAETDSKEPYITIGLPNTSFNLSFLDGLDVLVLFAWDLGIAPIINIIAHYKEKDRVKGMDAEHVFLFYCNKSPKDFIWLDDWAELSDMCLWFHPFLLVNEPDSSWKELEGSLSVNLTKAGLHSIPGIHAGLRIKAIGSGDKTFQKDCQRVFEGMSDYFDDTYTIDELCSTN